MLTCQQITELVTDYLEGRLSIRERLWFQVHVGMCGRCRAYLRQMRMTVRTLGRLPAESIPPELRALLVERFRGMRPRNGAAHAPRRWVTRIIDALEGALGARRGWTAAGFVLVAALLFLVLSGAMAGPLTDGEACVVRCVSTVLVAGGAPLAAIALMAWFARARVSLGVCVGATSLGALAGYLSLARTCSLALVAPHVLVFHFGAGLFAVALAAAASRLPARFVR